MQVVRTEVKAVTLEVDSRIDSLTANLRPYIRTIFIELARALIRAQELGNLGDGLEWVNKSTDNQAVLEVYLA